MGITWRAVATSAAALAALLQASVGDREALVAGTLLVVATALLHRGRGRLGAVALVALFGNLLAWMGPATWSNASYGSTFAGVAFPGLLAVLAAVGIVASVSWLRHDGPSPVPAVATALAAVPAWTAIVVVAGLTGADAAPPQPGDLALRARDLRFEPVELVARAGPTGIVLENHDLFWHTFTIEELDVDLRVPVRGMRRVELDLPVGTYEFVCDIPGHAAAGMEGTLVVG